MEKRKIALLGTAVYFAVILNLLSVRPLSAQKSIMENSTFTTDTVLDLQTRYVGECNGFTISGQAQLYSENSMIRVTVDDEDGYTYLVFESYPLISDGSIDYLPANGEETMVLPNNSRLKKMTIYLRNSELNVDRMDFLKEKRLSYEDSYIEHKTQVCQEKVERINSNLTENGALWRAKVSDYALIPFALKAVHFGGNDYIPDGYEFYGGGIFHNSIDSLPQNPNNLPYPFTNEEGEVEPGTFVKQCEFDWRKAHDANLPSSGYFDENDDYLEEGNGWMTQIKNQVRYSGGSPDFVFPNTRTCSNGCFIFAPVAALEATMNLQYAYHLDLDLSEQWAMETGYNEANAQYNCGTCMDEYINRVESIRTIQDGEHYYLNDTIYENGNFHVLDSVLIIGDENSDADTVPMVTEMDVSQEYEYELDSTMTVLFHVGTYPLKAGEMLYENILYMVNDVGHGGKSNRILSNIINHNIIDEERLPWQDTILFGDLDPEDENLPPYYAASLNSFFSPNNTMAVKRALLTHGPGAARPRSGHICALVGYGKLELGDTIHPTGGWSASGPLVINEESPFINQEYWIFKESKTPTWGDNGYVYIIRSGNLGWYDAVFIDGEIRDTLTTPELNPDFIYDKDGDGYCFWGSDEKPEGCDTCPDTPDCNDNDPLILGLDSFYRCKPDCQFADLVKTPLPDTIKNDTTIADAYILDNLVIDGNSMVTIIGDTYMGENIRIYVEHGSTLYLKYANMMRFCDDHWGGIVLRGNRDVNHGETGYSMLISKESLITDATIAVRGDVGAIINANKTTFKLNQTDVFLGPNYINKAASQVNNFTNASFNKCNFVTFDPICNTEANVKLRYVKGIEFTDCEFVDHRFSSFNAFDKTGIQALRAGFQINGNDQSLRNFQNLKYGVKSEYSNMLPVEIDGNEFESCCRSMYMSGGQNLTIINNTISVNDNDTIPGNDYPYGIYLNACNDMWIENNLIRYYHAGSFQHTHKEFTGIIAKDCDTEGEIYRNTIKQTDIAMQAIGRNRDLDNPSKGLDFVCNEFFRNSYDMFITPDLENPESTMLNSGISKFQGSLQDPAGNLFSDTITTSEIGSGDDELDDGPKPDQTWGAYFNIQNNTSFFTYYHHDTVNESRVRPDKTDGDLTLINTQIVDYDNACPDRTIDTTDDSGIGVIEPLSAEIENYDYQLTTLTDGGNTDLTVAEIVMANDNTAWQTYLGLMDKSPYLSEDALKEVARKEDALSAPMVRDVLAANPQASKSSEVKEILDERIDELPDYMLEQINSGLTNVSPKEYLEIMKAEKEKELQRIIQKKLYTLSRDSLVSQDSLVYYLSYHDNYASKKQLAAYYAGRQNYQMATSVLNGFVPESFEKQEEIQEICSFYTMLDDILNDSVAYDQLDTEQVSQLSTYSDASPMVAAHTRALLHLNHACNYNEPVYIPMNNKSMKIIPMSSENDVDELHVYPNPAKDYIVVSWKLDDMSEGGIQIFDNKGVMMYAAKIHLAENSRVIPVSELSAGLYTLILKSSGHVQKSVKFTIH